MAAAATAAGGGTGAAAAEAAVAFDVAKALLTHRDALKALAAKLKRPEARLVAVSKTKPAAAVALAYAHGQRHFGENYVSELVTKAPQLKASCPDVRWHFIGHLQSNKCKALLNAVPDLWCVETVDTIKLANALNRAAAAVIATRARTTGRLKVMVQVNTSAEASKSGCAPKECSAVVAHVLDARACPALEFVGLMTIGRYVPAPTALHAADFDVLKDCAARVAADCKLDTTANANANAIELSMGMSHDFALAVEHGSTNVRVGTAIFGTRDYTQVPDTVRAEAAAAGTLSPAPPPAPPGGAAAAAAGTAADAGAGARTGASAGAAAAAASAATPAFVAPASAPSSTPAPAAADAK